MAGDDLEPPATVATGLDVDTKHAFEALSQNYGGTPLDGGFPGVVAAARAAGVEAFAHALADGYATFLGERGTRLSGGQRQRIAIARAILKNPPVMLLDEATSSLDAESERLVQQALDDLMRGRTTIIIAHRLATVLKADRIMVMDHGRIVAAGSHESLRESNPLYAHLAALQFHPDEQEVTA